MKRKMIYIILLLLAAGLVVAGHATFRAAGRAPRGERLEKVKRSPHYSGGQFQNASETPQMTSEDGFFASMWKFLFGKRPNLKPSAPVPSCKTDLLSLDRNEEVVVWLGHSSLFIQTGGKRFLFDPVLTCKFPTNMFMTPFKGASVYSPEDIPEVDCLVITHDHWDHLDFATVRAIKERVGMVVCSLGIGENFAYWGYPEAKIHDLDWGESIAVGEITLRCLPARHFSGRLFARGKTFWGSYLIDSPARRIFVSGDGGRDTHFAEIGREYPGIDLAIMENGQYDKDWKYIHQMPDELPASIDEIAPRRVLTYHHSKFALANHPWTEPMDRILEASVGKEWKLLTPMIGEAVLLDQNQTFGAWWK